MSNELTNKFADKFSVNKTEVISVLKNTCFKGQVSDAQMTALLIVADQYGLNPFTREIYAFPDKNNGIVPVVGVDGWARILNENPNFNGMEFTDGGDGALPDWIECAIYRKDRSYPVKVREYMSECKRGSIPWQSHPRRMLRHKAMIQCARLAFGYVGIFDPDEAEAIVQNSQPKNMGEAEIVEEDKAIDIESMIQEVQKTETDEDALKYWKENNSKLSNSAGLHKRLKDAVILHRENLKFADIGNVVLVDAKEV